MLPMASDLVPYYADDSVALRLHKGTIYAAAGWEQVDTGNPNIATWRTPLPPLTPEQHVAVREASRVSERARRFRAQREAQAAQLSMAEVGV